MNKYIIPNDEQQRIIDDDNNIVVTAKPGSGKTFTIVQKIKKISRDLYDYQGVIAISFTRKASEELQSRCKKENIEKKGSFYGTIDNFYIYQIISPFAKHITRSNIKLEIISDKEIFNKYKGLEKIKEGITESVKEVLIKSLKDGYIFLDICGETADFILNNVIECKNYIKARYTHIFIDEYQDCGEIQNKIFIELINIGLVGVAVGDLDQAIYAFTNRYSKYLSELIINPNFNNYEITQNHRCHKSISNYSLKLLGINTKKEDDIRVFKVRINGSEKDIMHYIDNNINEIKKKYKVENNNEIAILCRSNNSVIQAHNYLNTKHKAFHENKLDRYNSYWARLYSELLKAYFNKDMYPINFVEKYFDEELNKKNFKKANMLVSKLFHINSTNLINNLNLFIDIAKLIYPNYENEEVNKVLIEILEHEEILFNYKPATEDEICIMTLHKSKGLEFKVVFHLDLYRWILPSEGDSVTSESLIQDLNLHYVGITRAKEACYLMQGTRRFRNRQNDYIDAIESEFLNKEGLSNLRININ